MKHTFPKIGDKVIFKGVPDIYYPMFTCMKKHAEEKLVIGQTYTARKVEVYSSWCAIWLDEVEGDVYFNRTFFT